MEREQQVIAQLSAYKRMKARMQVLENESIGGGVKVSRFQQDDQLQALHRKLRGMPSYMYLTKREQRLETVAHAYLTGYPVGTKAQLQAIPKNGADAEDSKLLRELRRKIEKVIETRGWEMDDLDAVLERVSELQDLQTEAEKIDRVLNALADYKPEYAKLLRLRYVEHMQAGDVAFELGVVRRTFERWRPAAIAEYIKLS